MIPLRDTVPSKNYPVVTHALIGLNVLVYLIQIAQGADIQRFIFVYGLVPARYTVPQIAAYFSTFDQLFAFVSFMFLHGGFLHILGNMWFLYIFGDNVEDRLGAIRFAAFYFLCGIASGVAHLLLNRYSNVPTIGASGAIAGVMGAYFICYPRAKILTLIPIFFIPYFVEIPAFFFLGVWLLFQFINAAGSFGQTGGVAWWAHIGGFVFGVIFLKAFTALPGTGVTNQMRRMTALKSTPRLQIIRPVGQDEDPHLYGTIVITPYEAHSGTRKLVNVPSGTGRRLIRVVIPPGIGEGKLLRLSGLGKATAGNHRGDLLLRVAIES